MSARSSAMRGSSVSGPKARIAKPVCAPIARALSASVTVARTASKRARSRSAKWRAVKPRPKTKRFIRAMFRGRPAPSSRSPRAIPRSRADRSPPRRTGPAARGPPRARRAGRRPRRPCRAPGRTDRRGVRSPSRRGRDRRNCPPRSSRCARSGPRPVRFTGVPAKNARKAASSRAARSARGGAARSARAASRVCAASVANLFQGQTARQSSQPNTRLPIAARNSSGMGPVVLDRQVGDAAAGIETVGRGERVRGADVEAGAAGAAMVGGGLVRLQVRAGEDRPEQQPVAVLARDQHGVLCPASRGPAASASGFSITGAVSQKTLTRTSPLAER